ncbi:MAG: thioredoxin-disulfide reductase [Anaerolineae bacterium]|nr:thioredoxin-disulfide reductase [Anaerolineae bacterium]
MLDFKLTPSQQEGQLEQEGDQIYDLIIIGGGPAGLTAAVYAGRAALRALLLGGVTPGGQIANTDRVENYPGFPEGISGAELAMRFQSQAEHFVTRLANDFVTKVDFSASPFTVKTHSETYQGRTVIVATGAFPRRLGVPGEKEYFGRGVSTCATCDGFFYKDRRVVVVGGGDSAIDEGLFLTKFASEVIVIHRRDELRATKSLQERAFTSPKMRFVWDTVVEEILGQDTVTGVRVRNVKTGETSTIGTDGVFVYVGLIPGTKLFEGQLELTEQGYVVADGHQRTSVPGVFAAGDVQSPDFRQVVIAAGAGAKAAIEADRYLAEAAGPNA